MMSKSNEETDMGCNAMEESSQTIRNIEGFDGIILLISKDVFDYFKRESKNAEDAYDDIFVTETKNATKKTPSIPNILSEENQDCESNVCPTSTYLKSKRISDNNNSCPNNIPACKSKLNEEDGIKINIKKELYDDISNQNGNSENISSESGSSEDVSDESGDEGELSIQSEKEEESETSLRSKALNTLLNNKTVLNSLNSLANERKLSKYKTSNSTKNITNDCQGLYSDKISKDKFKHSRDRYDKKTVNQGNEVKHRNNFSYDMSRSNLSRSEGSTKHTWKRPTENWEDEDLIKRNKFSNTERRQWRNDFRSNHYEETNVQRPHYFKRNYYNKTYYT